MTSCKRLSSVELSATKELFKRMNFPDDGKVHFSQEPTAMKVWAQPIPSLVLLMQWLSAECIDSVRYNWHVVSLVLKSL